MESVVDGRKELNFKGFVESLNDGLSSYLTFDSHLTLSVCVVSRKEFKKFEENDADILSLQFTDQRLVDVMSRPKGHLVVIDPNKYAVDCEKR